MKKLLIGLMTFALCTSQMHAMQMTSLRNKFMAMNKEELTNISDARNIIESMNDDERTAFGTAYNQKSAYAGYILTGIKVSGENIIKKYREDENNTLTIYAHDDKSAVHQQCYMNGTTLKQMNIIYFNAAKKMTYVRYTYPGQAEEEFFYDDVENPVQETRTLTMWGIMCKVGLSYE